MLRHNKYKQSHGRQKGGQDSNKNMKKTVGFPIHMQEAQHADGKLAMQ
jgi:hypothetical protein